MSVERFTIERREEWAVDQASTKPYPADGEFDARRIAAQHGGNPVRREVLVLTGEWEPRPTHPAQAGLFGVGVVRCARCGSPDHITGNCDVD